mmetsp:Transcript_14931/g.19472  ORF Transcript_14931/g.19472 Transcript_14931/m.19472 type:complete len:105 (+) Transcript_14931:1731-2045(+)
MRVIAQNLYDQIRAGLLSTMKISNHVQQETKINIFLEHTHNEIDPSEEEQENDKHLNTAPSHDRSVNISIRHAKNTIVSSCQLYNIVILFINLRLCIHMIFDSI